MGEKEKKERIQIINVVYSLVILVLLIIIVGLKNINNDYKRIIDTNFNNTNLCIEKLNKTTKFALNCTDELVTAKEYLEEDFCDGFIYYRTKFAKKEYKNLDASNMHKLCRELHFEYMLRTYDEYSIEEIEKEKELSYEELKNKTSPVFVAEIPEDLELEMNPKLMISELDPNMSLISVSGRTDNMVEGEDGEFFPIWEIKQDGDFYWKGKLIKRSEIIAEKLESFFYNPKEFCNSYNI